MAHRLASLLLSIACSSIACSSIACTSSPGSEAPKEASRAHASLAELLSRATSRHVRIERDGEYWVGFADEAPLAEVDRAGGELRARAIFDAACVALALDPALLGPIEWGEHPKPTACAPQLWPGTREPTTNALCVAFDNGHRPMWIDIHWSAAIAARHDAIKASRDVLAALEAHAPADVIWTRQARLSLDGARPVYRFTSTSGESLDTTTVDAVTGRVVDVRVVK